MTHREPKAKIKSRIKFKLPIIGNPPDVVHSVVIVVAQLLAFVWVRDTNEFLSNFIRKLVKNCSANTIPSHTLDFDFPLACFDRCGRRINAKKKKTTNKTHEIILMKRRRRRLLTAVAPPGPNSDELSN